MTLQTTDAISDTDRDSLHILPLGIIPLHTPGLRRARMIKNVRLESVIEMFGSSQTGSGQIEVEHAHREFGWPEVPIHPDLITLRKLATMPSFDVYSLRILLRDSGIEVNDFDVLRLSKAKSHELTSYMSQFTRPLILQVYGDRDISIQTFQDIIMLFREPDVKKARETLNIMARRLEINIEDIPKFLEDYGDIFLSLSYYRHCLDHIEPIGSAFLEWLDELKRNWQIRNDQALTKACRSVQETLNGTMAALTGRLESFDRSTKDMWENASADRFRKIERMVKSCHTSIGGVLCALTVKLETWARVFPHKNSGGPSRRAEFIMTEMRQGIEKIRDIECSAPVLAELR